MKLRPFILSAWLLGLSLGAFAQEKDLMPGMRPSESDVRNTIKETGYSPYAGRNFPTEVYFGDTHLHTYNSLDARGFGVTLGPEDAYRSALGLEVVSSNGTPMKLSRPLDFLVVAGSLAGFWVLERVAGFFLMKE